MSRFKRTILSLQDCPQKLPHLQERVDGEGSPCRGEGPLRPHLPEPGQQIPTRPGEIQNEDEDARGKDARARVKRIRTQV